MSPPPLLYATIGKGIHVLLSSVQRKEIMPFVRGTAAVSGGRGRSLGRLRPGLAAAAPAGLTDQKRQEGRKMDKHKRRSRTRLFPLRNWPLGWQQIMRRERRARGGGAWRAAVTRVERVERNRAAAAGSHAKAPRGGGWERGRVNAATKREKFPRVHRESRCSLGTKRTHARALTRTQTHTDAAAETIQRSNLGPSLSPPSPYRSTPTEYVSHFLPLLLPILERFQR